MGWVAEPPNEATLEVLVGVLRDSSIFEPSTTLNVALAQPMRLKRGPILRSLWRCLWEEPQGGSTPFQFSLIPDFPRVASKTPQTDERTFMKKLLCNFPILQTRTCEFALSPTPYFATASIPLVYQQYTTLFD